MISALVTAMLVPGLKVIGAAFARVMMFIVLFMFTFWELRRRLAFRFDREALVKTPFASLVMAIPIGLYEVFFSDMISVGPLVSAIVEILVGVVVYFFALSGFRALHKHDFELLRQVVPRFFHGFLSVIERFSVKS